MKDKIENIIKEYLVKEYGNDNALPKPVLNGLAEAINEKRFEIFEMVKREYIMEDIVCAEEDMDEKLTDDEVSLVLHRLDKYDNGNYELLCDIIDEIVDDRNEQEGE